MTTIDANTFLPCDSGHSSTRHLTTHMFAYAKFVLIPRGSTIRKTEQTTLAALYQMTPSQLHYTLGCEMKICSWILTC